MSLKLLELDPGGLDYICYFFEIQPHNVIARSEAIDPLLPFLFFFFFLFYISLRNVVAK